MGLGLWVWGLWFRVQGSALPPPRAHRMHALKAAPGEHSTRHVSRTSRGTCHTRHVTCI